ncbi:hypothetical protein OROMI_023593 [Orobanche minor]
MGLLINRPSSNSYTNIDQVEGVDETQHRRAQFLIYKVLQKADTRPPSWLRVKVCKLKIKIGKRLKKLMMKKGFSSNVSSAKAVLCRKITSVLKSCKFLLMIQEHGKHGSAVVATVPLVF